ncbi:peptidoglycan-binding domain-containing protein [Bacillus atrophaeus]|uniref:peptidoglycan-binding domain-containing protein n=1 Tax=Bacillus atrophaeus TaxID=1452 RepID=UPI002E138FBA
MQKGLAALYFYPEKDAKNNYCIDGVYGPKTATVVKPFQLMHGLSIDGIMDIRLKRNLSYF